MACVHSFWKQGFLHHDNACLPVQLNDNWSCSHLTESAAACFSWLLTPKMCRILIWPNCANKTSLISCHRCGIYICLVQCTHTSACNFQLHHHQVTTLWLPSDFLQRLQHNILVQKWSKQAEGDTWITVCRPATRAIWQQSCKLGGCK